MCSNVLWERPTSVSAATERERFLGPVFGFGNYSMRIIKHDEGDNARTFDLDREAWVMMLAFPKDLCSGPIIARAVSGFGILVDWHNTSTLSRVMAKVYLNNDALIPDSVKVNVGLLGKGCSWTVPIFSVKRKTVTEPPEEIAYDLEGPFHPLLTLLTPLKLSCHP
jgi:hypothetical protein